MLRCTENISSAPGGVDLDDLVNRYYAELYRFAFALTHSEVDAADMTQETFAVWATKGHQLRDISKVKTWLFTTLHRLFLQSRRRAMRFPHLELSEVEGELPRISPDRVSQLDFAQLLRALDQLDEVYRGAVTLFYLEDYSYKEIAETLHVKIGTVKSRIARGIALLQQAIVGRESHNRAKHLHTLPSRNQGENRSMLFQSLPDQAPAGTW